MITIKPKINCKGKRNTCTNRHRRHADKVTDGIKESGATIDRKKGRKERGGKVCDKIDVTWIANLLRNPYKTKRHAN